MRDYSFGDFLHKLRERCGLSQFQLGMLVGVSNKAVSKWENGLSKPKSQILYKLSYVLGVTVDELLACKYHSKESENEKGVFAMKNEIWKKTNGILRERYGNVLPVQVLNRYLSELAEIQDTDIIVYFDLLSKIQKLAKSKNEHIRVKGVTGASFIAFLMGATEINPLKPHYYCPVCHKIEFIENTFCGWDLPIKYCSCGKELLRDGHNVPFETLRLFLNRNIHIDLSVSSSLYNAIKETIFKYFFESTVVTLIRKEQPNIETIVITNDESLNLQTGKELSFEKYSDEMLNFPSITLMVDNELDSFRLLEMKTKTSFDDALFTSLDVLNGFKNNDTQGIPEFRTDFFKDLISKISLTSFNDLIQISGLSHGTSVWDDNVQELIKNKIPLSKIISYRDDVFNYIQEKMETQKISNSGYAFKIMEDTHRGVYARNGVSDEMKQQFSTLGVEEWFIHSIEKIRYLFPRVHGVLFVKYSLIMMWYKLNYPDEYKEIMLDR